MSRYDVIVLGLGGMGSAIADRLAAQGHSVLGLERFVAVHDQGSSHGESRVIRKAYFEDRRYVPLLLRAYDLWAELENDFGSQLLNKTSCLVLGPPGSPVLEGCRGSAKAFKLSHEVLEAGDVSERFGLKVSADTEGFLEPDGGYLLVEKCVEAFQRRARRNGAELQFEIRVSDWRRNGNGFDVVTDAGTYQCSKLVLAMGPWTGKSDLPLSVKRTVQYWFHPKAPSNHPVYFQDARDGRWIYGFPEINGRLKIAFHNLYEDCDPETIRRSVSAAEVDLMRKYGTDLISALGDFSHAKTCMYTMTPDEHFVLGTLHDPDVFIAAGFSGHGFKFASVVGDIAEDVLFKRRQYDADLELFDPRRF